MSNRRASQGVVADEPTKVRYDVFLDDGDVGPYEYAVADTLRQAKRVVSDALHSCERGDLRAGSVVEVVEVSERVVIRVKLGGQVPTRRSAQ